MDKCFIVVLLVLVAQIRATENISNYIEKLSTLCPYSSFCSKNTPKNYLWNDSQPCCRSCSCEKVCGLTNNCCYEELDTYHVIEQYDMKCILSAVSPPSVDINILRRTHQYYMIDTCLNISSSNDSNQCRKHNGTDYLSPVFASDTGFIYYNEYCATCNGANRSMYQHWNLFISPLDGFMSRIATTWSLQQTIEANRYFTLYVSPELQSASNWQCPTMEMKPNVCRLKDSGIAKLCEDIRMPFMFEKGRRHVYYYENVFCASCDIPHEELTYEDKCSVPIIDNKFNMFPIFRLLDDANIKHPSDLKRLLDVTVSRPTKNDSCVGEDIFNSFTNSCIVPICPEGSVNDGEKCQSLGLTVAVNTGGVQLKLLPTSPNAPTTAMFDSLSVAKQTQPSLWVSSTCLQNHELKTLLSLYASSAHSNVSHPVESLILRIRFNFEAVKSVDAVKLYKIIHETCVKNNKWVLIISGRRFVFESELDKYRDFVQDGKEMRTLDMAAVDEKLPKLWNLVAEENNNYEAWQALLEMHFIKNMFCTQVELVAEEVQVGPSTIRILPSMHELGDNMFVSDPTMKHETHHRICLDDFYKARGIAIPANQSDPSIYGSSDVTLVALILLLVGILAWVMVRL